MRSAAVPWFRVTEEHQRERRVAAAAAGGSTPSEPRGLEAVGLGDDRARSGDRRDPGG